MGIGIGDSLGDSTLRVERTGLSYSVEEFRSHWLGRDRKREAVPFAPLLTALRKIPICPTNEKRTGRTTTA